MFSFADLLLQLVFQTPKLFLYIQQSEHFFISVEKRGINLTVNVPHAFQLIDSLVVRVKDVQIFKISG